MICFHFKYCYCPGKQPGSCRRMPIININQSETCNTEVAMKRTSHISTKPYKFCMQVVINMLFTWFMARHRSLKIIIMKYMVS